MKGLHCWNIRLRKPPTARPTTNMRFLLFGGEHQLIPINDEQFLATGQQQIGRMTIGMTQGLMMYLEADDQAFRTNPPSSRSPPALRSKTRRILFQRGCRILDSAVYDERPYP